jgi:hypothetical protein
MDCGFDVIFLCTRYEFLDLSLFESNRDFTVMSQMSLILYWGHGKKSCEWRGWFVSVRLALYSPPVPCDVSTGPQWLSPVNFKTLLS